MDIEFYGTKFCFKPLTRVACKACNASSASSACSVRIAAVASCGRRKKEEVAGGGDWVEQKAVLKHKLQTVLFEVVG